MAVGDQDDFIGRIKALLPNGWFQGATPVLDALLAGYAWVLSFVYALVQYAQFQTRIKTATAAFLNLIALDFFWNEIKRRKQETDNSFRTRILANLFRERATRKGMSAAIVALTARTPIIVEPARPLDVVCYDANYGYDVGGYYGSLEDPYQCFVQAFRPTEFGAAGIPGYEAGPSGYDTGYMPWASEDTVFGSIPDTEIYDTIERTKPAGTTVWTNISS